MSIFTILSSQLLFISSRMSEAVAVSRPFGCQTEVTDLTKHTRHVAMLKSSTTFASFVTAVKLWKKEEEKKSKVLCGACTCLLLKTCRKFSTGLWNDNISIGVKFMDFVRQIELNQEISPELHWSSAMCVYGDVSAKCFKNNLWRICFIDYIKCTLAVYVTSS